MKVITSQSKTWSGSVILADPLTMPQVKAIEQTLNASIDKSSERVWLSVVDETMLPAICACVQEWRLSNFPEFVTPDTFPASPRKESHELIRWLFSEIYKVYIGEIAVPNE